MELWTFAKVMSGMSPAVLGRLDLHPLTAAIIHCLWGKAESPHSCPQTSVTTDELVLQGTDLQGQSVFKDAVIKKARKHAGTRAATVCVYTRAFHPQLRQDHLSSFSPRWRKAKSLMCSPHICHRPRVCIKTADVAQWMCSDLLDCSTLECACEPQVSYKCVTGNQCLICTGLIQNPVIFVFWHFSMVFKAYKTQWDAWKHFGKLGVVIKDQPITLDGYTSTYIHLLQNIHRDQIWPRHPLSNLVQLPLGTKLTVLVIFITALHMRMLSCCLYDDIVRTNPAPDVH